MICASYLDRGTIDCSGVGYTVNIVFLALASLVWIYWYYLLILVVVDSFSPLFDIIMEEYHIERSSVRGFDDSHDIGPKGDPLFLQNSDHPGMTLVISMLIGNNY